ILRKDFAFRDPVPPSAAAIAHKIARPGSVCLHVRRGDYVSVPENANTMGFVGLAYYQRAAERIRSLVHEPRFFVFSDDIAWCRENLGWLGSNTAFVSPDVPSGVKAH